MVMPTLTRRTVDQLTIIGFLTVLFGSLLLTVLHRHDNFLVAEKRNRAGRPDFSVARWLAAGWQPAFEKYFNDRFGGRDTAVRWNNLTHVAAFGLSPVPMVMVGRDGQLLYAAEGTIDDFRNLDPFTPTEVDALARRVAAMRDDAEARGAVFAVLIAPNTATIYPQTVPPVYNRVTETTRFDQAVAALQAKKITIVDPRPELRQAAANERVYHLTDTHWNDRGGYLAYAKLVDALHPTAPSLTPTPIGSFNVRQGWTKGGDLANALSLADLYPTRSTWLVPKQPTRAVLVPAEYPTARLVRPPKVTEVADRALPTAVVFRDSFSKAIEPLLSEHFRRVAYIRSPHPVAEVLDVELPDVIILEIAERYLGKLVNGEEIFDPTQ